MTAGAPDDRGRWSVGEAHHHHSAPPISPVSWSTRVAMSALIGSEGPDIPLGQNGTAGSKKRQKGLGHGTPGRVWVP